MHDDDVTAIFHAGQALVVGQHALGQGVDQQGVKVATVHGQVRRAVFLDGVIAQRNLRQDIARFPMTAVPEVRMRALGIERIFNTDAAQDLHDVRPHVDAGPKPRKAGRLLVDADVQPFLEQQRGGGGAAKTRADDGDTRGCRHGTSPCWMVKDWESEFLKIMTYTLNLWIQKFSIQA
ncbi:hypothetical protein D3C78_1259790 [compost metagenome]